MLTLPLFNNEARSDSPDTCRVNRLYPIAITSCSRTAKSAHKIPEKKSREVSTRQLEGACPLRPTARILLLRLEAAPLPSGQTDTKLELSISP